MIDQDGVHPAPEKIPSVMDWAKHKNQKELQPFCGIVNIISQFFHYAATVTPTLTELTWESESLWTDLQDAAFEDVKWGAENHQGLWPIIYLITDMVWLLTDALPTTTGA